MILNRIKISVMSSPTEIILSDKIVKEHRVGDEMKLSKKVKDLERFDAKSIKFKLDLSNVPQGQKVLLITDVTVSESLFIYF